jgi:tetratricopeptide (TPR) repeat protein
MLGVNHGVYLLRQGAHPEAQAAFRDAIPAGEHSKNLLVGVLARGNLAASLIATGELDAAEPELVQAITDARENGQPKHEAVFTALLVGMYREKGNRVESRPLLDRALMLARRAGDPFITARVLCEDAFDRALSGQRDAALQSLEEAEALANTLGLSDEVLRLDLSKARELLVSQSADRTDG